MSTSLVSHTFRCRYGGNGGNGGDGGDNAIRGQVRSVVSFDAHTWSELAPGSVLSLPLGRAFDQTSGLTVRVTSVIRTRPSADGNDQPRPVAVVLGCLAASVDTLPPNCPPSERLLATEHADGSVMIHVVSAKAELGATLSVTRSDNGNAFRPATLTVGPLASAFCHLPRPEPALAADESGDNPALDLFAAELVDEAAAEAAAGGSLLFPTGGKASAGRARVSTRSSVPIFTTRANAPDCFHLDFDGGVVTGSAWNAYTSQPAMVYDAWSLDGNFVDFSSAERDVIKAVVTRVAEDFIAFNVTVTTDESICAAYPPQRRATIAITPPTAGWRRPAASRLRLLPAVMGLSDHLDDRVNAIGDSVSHELGHQLGLSHDGWAILSHYLGHYGWGPIMGTPYTMSVTQWSKGEYSGATNTEDDLAIIGTKLSHARDSIGDTFADALDIMTAPRPPAYSIISAITSSSDVDCISFVAGNGSITVTAHILADGPNLDVGLTAYIDVEAEPVVTVAPDDQLHAELLLVEPENGRRYAVCVTGTGNRIGFSSGFSDYGSLGYYGLVVDGPFGDFNDLTPPFGVLEGRSAVVANSTTVSAPEVLKTPLIVRDGAHLDIADNLAVPAGCVRIEDVSTLAIGSGVQLTAACFVQAPQASLVVAIARGASPSLAVEGSVELGGSLEVVLNADVRLMPGDEQSSCSIHAQQPDSSSDATTTTAPPPRASNRNIVLAVLISSGIVVVISAIVITLMYKRSRTRRIVRPKIGARPPPLSDAEALAVASAISLGPQAPEPSSTDDTSQLSSDEI
ncbi:uncharacterized protein AMSG_10426 [Thecamonas trahens ATCC 50062]|uniref:Uncharacterized protein n=1 Tax=Thecamonas trahens ATCC 50062 TaxID=461836 RepID=A0A0L0DQL2_THETB|nr:hypothetical protein AMSG_10426 [Thecamonas trahens ATCC 50062]KNC54572.1 hypothetical protein AMSG_10426 [Thecamonas trahens ATCC 50062]|eukprot:XP_013753585.1 hypothetical protein AMSG_10426 [Thecamonas trahens ATCC 50062]